MYLRCTLIGTQISSHLIHFYIIRTNRYFSIKILSNLVQTQVCVIYTKIEIQHMSTFTATFKHFKVFTIWTDIKTDHH